MVELNTEHGFWTPKKHVNTKNGFYFYLKKPIGDVLMDRNQSFLDECVMFLTSNFDVKQ